MQIQTLVSPLTLWNHKMWIKQFGKHLTVLSVLLIIYLFCYMAIGGTKNWNVLVAPSTSLICGVVIIAAGNRMENSVAKFKS